jgi:tripartite-type tricarboxylate transporter receptor subunit TctC
MSLYRKLNYDATRFRPVALMASSPNVLVVRSGLPAASARELIAFGKANPGKLNYASQGHGTTSHLTTEMFQLETGLALTHVPYRGTAPAINDIVANQMDLMFVNLAAAIGLHEAGNLRILAIAAEERVPELPDIPTLEELGLKNFRSATWNAIAAPPGTSEAITTKLNIAVNEILKTPEVEAQLKKIHLRPLGGTPGDMLRTIEAERQRWSAVIQASGVKLD